MIGVWPLIMGFTMWLQTKLNPQPTDPMQAKVMLFLPVMFIFLFADLPGRPGDLLDLEQHPLDRPAMGDHEADGREGDVTPVATGGAATRGDPPPPRPIRAGPRPASVGGRTVRAPREQPALPDRFGTWHWAGSTRGAARRSLPEVAFAGRSNVGKSSLINALTGRRASRAPPTRRAAPRRSTCSTSAAGCTLVDLPGYGFAQAPKDVVERWTGLVFAYLRGRPSLRAGLPADRRAPRPRRRSTRR